MFCAWTKRFASHWRFVQVSFDVLSIKLHLLISVFLSAVFVSNKLLRLTEKEFYNVRAPGMKKILIFLVEAVGGYFEHLLK
jgi:type IV secretory pathway TrbL component